MNNATMTKNAFSIADNIKRLQNRFLNSYTERQLQIIFDNFFKITAINPNFIKFFHYEKEMTINFVDLDNSNKSIAILEDKESQVINFQRVEQFLKQITLDTIKNKKESLDLKIVKETKKQKTSSSDFNAFKRIAKINNISELISNKTFDLRMTNVQKIEENVFTFKKDNVNYIVSKTMIQADDVVVEPGLISQFFGKVLIQYKNSKALKFNKPVQKEKVQPITEQPIEKEPEQASALIKDLSLEMNQMIKNFCQEEEKTMTFAKSRNLLIVNFISNKTKKTMTIDGSVEEVESILEMLLFEYK